MPRSRRGKEIPCRAGIAGRPALHPVLQGLTPEAPLVWPHTVVAHKGVRRQLAIVAVAHQLSLGDGAPVAVRGKIRPLIRHVGVVHPQLLSLQARAQLNNINVDIAQVIGHRCAADTALDSG